MINGIINVYKEKDYTSHDVVAKLRGILKQKKIGHTGTLDPDATGVLPVCLGNGTKLCDILTDKSKEYEAVFLLGITTDTQDTTGTVLEQKEVFVTEEEVRKAVMSFAGEYDQIPPMYSALKVNGKKLYELAREGKVIERKPRRISIDEIMIMDIKIPEVKIRVSCSKGTYIRTLCHDIGQMLHCGAAMSQLVRTRVGNFKIEEAITLTELEKRRDEKTLDEKIIKVESMFEQLPVITVKSEFRKWIDNGNSIFPNQTEENKQYEEGEQVRIHNNDQMFCGIYEFKEGKNCFMPLKMFQNGEL